MNQAYLLNIVAYDPESGFFTWRSGSGLRAGYKHHTGYIYIKIMGKEYAAHRLAWLYMNGSLPDGFIDHVNRIRADNRICNLREATRKENNRNSMLRKDNSSGFKSVSLHKPSNKWAVNVRVNGVKKYFGSFNDLELAALVAEEARAILHGPFSS